MYAMLSRPAASASITVILAFVVIHVVVRQVVGPLMDARQARKRKNEHAE